MRHCGWLLGLLSLFSLATHASDWQEIKNEAKGQTVWFNAWGGDTAINRYLDWVSGEMKTHYAINLKIVRLADAADAVKRIQTEAAAGALGDFHTGDIHTKLTQAHLRNARADKRSYYRIER